MEVIFVEFTIKKIVSIDEDAKNYKLNMEQLLLNKKKELNDTIINMQRASDEEIDQKKKEIYEIKMKEADDVVKKINIESKNTIDKIEYLYKNEKEAIIDEAFKSIINSCRK